MRYFETIFLEDVMLFLETLDVKTVRKILFNIDLAEQTNDATLFKKLQKTFGNSEHYIPENKYVCWHFGIKRGQTKPWLYQPMA